MVFLFDGEQMDIDAIWSLTIEYFWATVQGTQGSYKPFSGRLPFGAEIVTQVAYHRGEHNTEALALVRTS